MTTNQDETDGVQGFLMELLYTSLGREKPCWYHPEPEELRQAIDREVVRITILWQRFAFVTVNVSVYTGYVRRQQMVLLHCLDWLDSIGEEREDIRVGKAAIQQLLDFLLEHFEDALQKRLIIPAFQQARIVAQLKMDLPHCGRICIFYRRSARQQLFLWASTHDAKFDAVSNRFKGKFNAHLSATDFFEL
jgi:hypothetical protein